jgi:hypothetical protein
MAVTLEYVSVRELSDVMTVEEQADATDDDFAEGGTIESGEEQERNYPMVKRFLARAEGLAERYVGTRYQVPIDDPTPMFKYTILIIARYFLDERGDGDVSESVRESYRMAISWLEDIRDEVADLHGENTEAIDDYYGERYGGTFGEGPFNDKGTAFTGEPFPA